MAASDSERGNNQALIDAMARLLPAQLVEIARGDANKTSVLFAREGIQVHSIKDLFEEYLPAPERKEGTAQFTTLDSFIAHANRFKALHSAVFADDDMQEPRLISVLDYHEAGDGSPHFGRHRGVYQFPLSDEWKAWMEINGKEVKQRVFAEFLEDRIGDIADPKNASDGVWDFVEKLGLLLATPNQLLELSRGLTVNVNARVANHANLSTGEGRVQFETTHTDAAGAQIKVPGGFALEIPVFRNGIVYRIAVRLRYRIVEGAVCWKMLVYRTDLAFRDAFDEACKTVATQTALPLFVGSPES